MLSRCHHRSDEDTSRVNAKESQVCSSLGRIHTLSAETIVTL